jgi:hypothetical protein
MPLLSRLRGLAQRTRQHHAIEHATLHLLAAAFPERSFAGYSDPQGFTIYGAVETETLRRTVGEALRRLQAGEAHLAIHPNCGTVLATSTLLATVGALAGMSGRRRPPFDRFASGLMLVLAGQMAGQPLGLWLQSYTTDPAVARRELVAVRPLRAGPVRAHRVVFT